MSNSIQLKQAKRKLQDMLRMIKDFERFEGELPQTNFDAIKDAHWQLIDPHFYLTWKDGE